MHVKVNFLFVSVTLFEAQVSVCSVVTSILFQAVSIKWLLKAKYP